MLTHGRVNSVWFLEFLENPLHSSKLIEDPAGSAVWQLDFGGGVYRYCNRWMTSSSREFQIISKNSSKIVRNRKNLPKFVQNLSKMCPTLEKIPSNSSKIVRNRKNRPKFVQNLRKSQRIVENLLKFQQNFKKILKIRQKSQKSSKIWENPTEYQRIVQNLLKISTEFQNNSSNIVQNVSKFVKIPSNSTELSRIYPKFQQNFRNLIRNCQKSQKSSKMCPKLEKIPKNRSEFN